jgi:tRNA-splicing ligase RtcB
MDKINDKIGTFLDPATIEPPAKQQLLNISELHFVFKHIAVMPDCHLGKGATVGSVIVTKGAIIPAAVGVDIGCGMIAVKTKFNAKDLPDNLEELRRNIERRIPLGAGAFNRKVTASASARIDKLKKIIRTGSMNSSMTGFARWRISIKVAAGCFPGTATR